MMDKESWTDERVLSWLARHAVAVKLDVDRDPERARALRIEAMPTMVVFKDGAEFDRVQGYRSADDLMEWLDGLARGRREIDGLRAAAGARAVPGGKLDVRARYRLAGMLIQAGDLDEATEELVWLWENMLDHEPAMYGVRLSFMVRDMQRLAERHEPARTAFTKLRDRLSVSIDGGRPGREDLIDWIHLNQVIGDQEATLTWYDRIKGRPSAAEQFSHVDRDLFELLIQSERWADAGAFHADPASVITQAIARAAEYASYEKERLDEQEQRQSAAYRRQSLREDASVLYAACLAAGRDNAAAEVASLLLTQQDDAPARAALIEAALWAGQPRPGQRRWLDEAEGMGEPQDALRQRLEEALAGP
jgi:thioredoxin-like negative regulator of GroEL